MTSNLMSSCACIILVELLVIHISMGVGVQSKAFLAEDLSRATKLVQEMILKDEIVIFSKTYCPYCKMAKGVFDSIHRKYTSIELDKREDGGVIQEVLGQLTGEHTVPRVFVKGRCIGGGNDVKKLQETGTLSKILN